MVDCEGLEPTARWLRVSCSTNWANSPLCIVSNHWRALQDSNPRPADPKSAALSYWAKNAVYILWGEWRDLNPQPPEPQSEALTKLRYTHHVFKLLTTRGLPTTCRLHTIHELIRPCRLTINQWLLATLDLSTTCNLLTNHELLATRWLLTNCRLTTNHEVFITHWHNSLNLTEHHCKNTNILVNLASSATLLHPHADSANCLFTGAPCRIRTRGLRLRRPLLYPAELRARILHTLRVALSTSGAGNGIRTRDLRLGRPSL